MVENIGNQLQLRENPEDSNYQTNLIAQKQKAEKDQQQQLILLFLTVCKSYQSARDFSLILHKTQKETLAYKFIQDVYDAGQAINVDTAQKKTIFQIAYQDLNRINDCIRNSLQNLKLNFNQRIVEFDPEYIASLFDSVKETSLPELKELIKKFTDSIESLSFNEMSSKILKIVSDSSQLLPKFTEKELEENKNLQDYYLEQSIKKQKDRDKLQAQISAAIISQGKAAQKVQQLESDKKEKDKEIVLEIEEIDKIKVKLEATTNDTDKKGEKMMVDFEKRMNKEFQNLEKEFNQELKELKSERAAKKKIKDYLQNKRDKIIRCVQAKPGQKKEVCFYILHVIDKSYSMNGKPFELALQNVMRINEQRKNSENDTLTVQFFNDKVQTFASQIHPSDLQPFNVISEGGTNFTNAFEQMQLQIQTIDDDQVGLIIFYTDGDARIDKALLIAKDIYEKYKERDLPVFFIVLGFSANCVKQNLIKIALAGNGGKIKANFGNVSFDLFYYCETQEDFRLSLDNLQKLLVELSHQDRLIESFNERIAMVDCELDQLQSKENDNLKTMMLKQQEYQENIKQHLLRSIDQTREFLITEAKTLQGKLAEKEDRLSKLNQELQLILQEINIWKQKLQEEEENAFFKNGDKLLKQLDKEEGDESDELNMQRNQRKNLLEIGIIFSKHDIALAKSQVQTLKDSCESMKQIVLSIIGSLKRIEQEINDALKHSRRNKLHVQQHKVAEQVMKHIIKSHTNQDVNENDASNLDELVKIMLTQLKFADDQEVCDFFKMNFTIDLLYDFKEQRETEVDNQPQTSTSYQPKQHLIDKKNLLNKILEQPNKEKLQALYLKMKQFFSSKLEDFTEIVRFQEIGVKIEKHQKSIEHMITQLQQSLFHLIKINLGDSVQCLESNGSMNAGALAILN